LQRPGSICTSIVCSSSAAAASLGYVRGGGSVLYTNVPKQAPEATASVDFLGEIVTKQESAEDDDAYCRLEQQHQQQQTAARTTEQTEETAVICAIAKYEEPYLDEWVDYHLSLGFAHIMIYDNTVDFELKEWARKKSCRVSVRHFPGGSAPQAKAYLNCARHWSSSSSSSSSFGQQQRQQRRNHTWIAFFDIDEFLILIDQKYQNILRTDHAEKNTSTPSGYGAGEAGGGAVVPFLQDHCPRDHCQSLGVNWRVMGTAGHTLYQPAPVTLRFQYAVDRGAEQHVKSIARLEDLNLDRVSHVHYPRLIKRIKYEGNNMTPVAVPRQRDTSGRVFSGPFNPNGPTDVALFYHYAYVVCSPPRSTLLLL
jgi:Glycosyl transferase family 2